MNQLMSNGGDCRTDPATPGLLNSSLYLRLNYIIIQINGVVPNNNRHSTDKLHHFVQQKTKKLNMLQSTCDR